MLVLSPHPVLLLEDVIHAMARSLIAVCAGNRRYTAGGKHVTRDVAHAVRELEHVLVLAVGRGFLSETAARSVAGLAYDAAGQA